MRVRITKTVYSFDLTLPVEVTCEYISGLYMVSSSELVRVGGNLPDDGFKYAFVESEVVEVQPVLVEQTETPCIRDMCCNQFGERDEMQNIINSLQADVIARGARIKMLEDERDELQRRLDHNAQV